jgi:uncharacterized protein (TIGR02246 family)
VNADVRRLSDLEAIRDLARRYAHCIWQRDAAGAAELFTADGTMDTGDRPPLRGAEAIRAEYEALFAASELRPMIHNHVIDLNGDRAEGTCYLDLTARMDSTEMTGRGFYRDRYDRTDGVWKFSSRVLTMTHFVPAPEPATKAP